MSTSSSIGHKFPLAIFGIVLTVWFSCGRAPQASTPTIATTPADAARSTTPTPGRAAAPTPEPAAARTTAATPSPVSRHAATGRVQQSLPAGMLLPPGPASGALFGPFHLPEAEFSSRFTGAFRTFRPDDLVATLEAARQARIRLIIHLVGGRRRHQEASGAFSLSRFRQALDVYGRVDLAPYVADGTLVGHLLFDEPHDPTNWNGAPVPYRDIEAAAAHSKQLWPTLPVGVAGPPSYLRGGARWSALDFGYAQYTTRRGDIATWLRQEVDAAQQSGVGAAFGINVLGGNNRSRVTATQLKEWGTALLSEPSACAVLMWKYDQRDGGAYFRDPAVADAIEALAQIARQRSPVACRR